MRYTNYQVEQYCLNLLKQYENDEEMSDYDKDLIKLFGTPNHTTDKEVNIKMFFELYEEIEEDMERKGIKKIW